MIWPIDIFVGDVRDRLKDLPSDHFDVVCTSPPYWGLRDYGAEGQIGLEPTLGEHIRVMVEVFREVRRVMKPTGTLWLNYGDCYATSPNGRSAADTKALSDDDRTFRDKPFSTVGPIYEPQPNTRQEARRGRSGNLGNGGQNGASVPDGRVVAGGFLKPKDLCMVPNRIAIALQEDGWWVRSEIVWGKTNPMPESIGDRPATAHEKIFLLTKSERYAYDNAAVRQVGVPDSVDRYHRGRSDHHKWADGGPGNQTIAKSFEGMAAKHPKPVRGRDTHGRHTMGEEIPAVERRAPRTKKPRSPRQTAIAEGAGASSSSRRMAGFNERWDEKQQGLKNSFARPTNGHAGDRGEKPQHRADRDPVDYSGSRNLRNYEPAELGVWEISTAPFSGEFCTACEAYFQGPSLRRLKVEEVERDGKPVTVRYCTCGSTDHWLSHFATFPPELAARCLRTAPKFCCHVCSTPWERVVEKDFVPQPDVSPDRGERRADQHDASSNWGQTPRGSSTHRTTGFRPTCKCEGSKPAPPRVLDPFGGAGTTALVAWRMQIPSTVIELNAHYARLAMERLKADQGMWADVRLHEPGPAEQVA